MIFVESQDDVEKANVENTLPKSQEQEVQELFVPSIILPKKPRLRQADRQQLEPIARDNR